VTTLPNRTEFFLVHCGPLIQSHTAA
jgi:hypothetical protein